MKKKSNSKSAFFNFRVLIGLFVVLAGVYLALLGFGFFSSAKAQPRNAENDNANAVAVAQAITTVSAKSFNGDVRTLPPVACAIATADGPRERVARPLASTRLRRVRSPRKT